MLVYDYQKIVTKTAVNILKTAHNALKNII